MNTVHIITTGGTIDKVYQPHDGSMGFVQSIIPKILETARLAVDYHIEALFQKDSLDIKQQEREQILDAVQASPAKQILITHGTDTMAQTAILLGDYLNNHDSNKTIVLVGAMVPYRVAESDALFNLGAALLAVQTLKKGCYVVMNGQVFTHDNVEKNHQQLIFQTKN